MSSSANKNTFRLPANMKTRLNLTNNQLINSGKYGSVYKSTNNNNVIKVTTSDNKMTLLNELKMSILAGLHGIGPKVNTSRSSVKLYKNNTFVLVITMENMEYTLEDYLSKNPDVSSLENTRQSIRDLVNQLHAHDICHADIHVKNIMFKKGSWYLIDFGKACINSTCSSNVNKVGVLSRMFSNRIGRQKLAQQRRSENNTPRRMSHVNSSPGPTRALKF